MEEGAVLPALCAPKDPLPLTAPYPTTTLAGWDTRPSKVRSHIRSVLAVMAANAQFLRMRATHSKPVHHRVKQLKFAQSLHFCGPGAHWASLLWESWILTGLVKIPHTNYPRLASPIHSLKPSDGILAPSGSRSQSTSKGWHLQATRSAILLVVLTVRHGAGEHSPAPLLLLMWEMFVKFLPNKQFRTVEKKIIMSLLKKTF